MTDTKISGSIGFSVGGDVLVGGMIPVGLPIRDADGRDIGHVVRSDVADGAYFVEVRLTDDRVIRRLLGAHRTMRVGYSISGGHEGEDPGRTLELERPSPAHDVTSSH